MYFFFLIDKFISIFNRKCCLGFCSKKYKSHVYFFFISIWHFFFLINNLSKLIFLFFQWNSVWKVINFWFSFFVFIFFCIFQFFVFRFSFFVFVFCFPFFVFWFSFFNFRFSYFSRFSLFVFRFPFCFVFRLSFWFFPLLPFCARRASLAGPRFILFYFNERYFW